MSVNEGVREIGGVAILPSRVGGPHKKCLIGVLPQEVARCVSERFGLDTHEVCGLWRCDMKVENHDMSQPQMEIMEFSPSQASSKMAGDTCFQ